MMRKILEDNNIRFCSVHEIASMAELTVKRIYQLQAYDKFPKPYQQLGCGPIWLQSDIEQYIHDEQKRFAYINKLCDTDIKPFKQGASMKAVWALHKLDIPLEELKQILLSFDWLEYYRGIARNPKV
jgi:predicted DNA-binding transcriptional regulator AlpA